MQTAIDKTNDDDLSDTKEDEDDDGLDSYQREEIEKARKEFEKLELEHNQMLYMADGVKSENNYQHSEIPSRKTEKRSESIKNANRGKLEYIDN